MLSVAEAAGPWRLRNRDEIARPTVHQSPSSKSPASSICGWEITGTSNAGTLNFIRTVIELHQSVSARETTQ
jgi:hypothetical protein